MSSICISNCVNDAKLPVRATYVNLYKWPESDAEFVRTVSTSKMHGGERANAHHPRVVDSISCRQLYLRSYTFSRKESVPERTKKCLGRVREKMRVPAGGRRRRRRRRCAVVTRVKELSRAAMSAIFRRLLSCAATVDVIEFEI
ncbi:hypothetical protein RJ640_024216 [Escallonia rubra]|uniref:Uncharacterized protein n=1 Tax=Escallonia rubra TaxID=112253 RepID=A0AA88UQH7_9ASTE|nr:hypothetical protein RJ640_024216 [Escallonia rubra]